MVVSTPGRSSLLPDHGPLVEEPLVVVSNREPYVHTHGEAGVTVDRSIGGLTTALDSVMQELGGVWVAWGSGDADETVTDGEGGVNVPPDDPAYRLQRVFLPDDIVDAFYFGYSNRVLWPLSHSHLGYVEPDPGYWAGYVDANARFSRAIEEQVRGSGTVWIHDYQLALVGRELRHSSPKDVTLAYYWHIPWPPPSVFTVLPQSEQLVAAMLAYDGIGFQTSTYRDHFLGAVQEELPSAELEEGTIRYDGAETRVFVHPVGIDVGRIRSQVRDRSDTRGTEPIRSKYELGAKTIVLSVERIDYTKGIIDRLASLEYLFEQNPGLRGEVVHVMISTPTRELIPAYRRYRRRVDETVQRINDRFGEDLWRPIHHFDSMISRPELLDLYRAADVCVISSRKDGLNLVAMEYLTANRETDGHLLLSRFAGASEYLDEAVLVNPLDIESVADHLLKAVRDQHSTAEGPSRSHDPTGFDYGMSDWIGAVNDQLRAIQESR